jgi:hypothetical protein
MENLHEKCDGCNHIQNNQCSVYPYPEIKWRQLMNFPEGVCPSATHESTNYTKLKSGRVVTVKEKYVCIFGKRLGAFMLKAFDLKTQKDEDEKRRR